MTDPVAPDQALSRRRKLLLAVPFGIAALQGCSGATAAPAPGPAPAPAPAPAGPAPISVVSGWAARPAASASTGLAIFVPDVGAGGSLWISNGSAWVPVSSPLTLAHKFSNARMDASVGAFADVLLDSVTIPAYVLGPSSGLRITAAWSFFGAGSRTPQIRAWFGVGSYAVTFTPLFDSRGQFSTQATVLTNVTLQNRNSMSANQLRPIDYGFGVSGNAFQSSTIDFSQDVTIGFGALNNSGSTNPGEQQVLEWFSVEMLA